MGKDYSNLRDAIRYCSGIGKCENCPQDFQCNGTSGSWYMLRLISDALDELEKRVEVVRCRECEYRDYDDAPYGKKVAVCTGAMAYSNTPDDWYCPMGKRKEGGQDDV